ncbi:hypothetical protein AC579_2952 [Pseudocercospora musae]|uniref:Uncharacterized protein n=1 Tax=Pseudocercospora musae TaxID=113226 RepID=A0A139I6B1_9PEZI|nr:hypothetical protein AC579_2952 [Pseudocercospora musae]
MVVVRESPRAQTSPSKNDTQWPPRSPFQALLSSPSGRRKWQDYKSRSEQDRSPSPSPRRRPLSSSHQKLQDLANMPSEGEEEEEEDEETLQLQLQEIQAKLRLKKLQSAKKKGECRSSHDSTPSLRAPRAGSPRTLYESALPVPNLQVPLSPAREQRTLHDPVSPARARLGLTSNPKAAEVSLKRARDDSQVKRSNSTRSLHTATEDQPKVKSFSERLAESKLKDEVRQAKVDRLQQVRSSGFSSHARSDSSSSRATPASATRRSRADNDARPSSAGRSQESRAESTGSGISRSGSLRTARDSQKESRGSSKINAGHEHAEGTGHAESDLDETMDIDDTNPDPDSGYDPFSKIHLSKRHISHAVVAREMEGKEIYTVPRLLKEVKAPDYEPPDCESDYVVYAVLASKSTPFDHAETHRTNEQAKEIIEAPRNKFMVLHLCDLKWEIDCFLFGTAFNQFWKLTPGTLLAILNPAIMPPKGSQHSGRFSLKLGSSEDAVMELGVARDLGYCVSIKKDGQQCGQWVDKRKTEACDFHINLQVEKARKGRMEVNTMFHDGDRDFRANSKKAKDAEFKKKKMPGSYNREYGQLYHVAGTGKSAATLLDDDNKRIYDTKTEEEASRKRIADAQKERDLKRQLEDLGKGKGVGAEYLRARHTKTTSSTTFSTTTSSRTDAAEEARKALFEKKSAAELGLLGKKAETAHLSPAKDRKKHFGLGALSIPSSNQTAATSKHKSSEPMGWGGAKKAGLLQPKETRHVSPERGQVQLNVERQSRTNLVRSRSQHSSIRSSGSQSPTKKKARFDLEAKGIKVPGRESLPGEAAKRPIVDSEDDDLDIV